MRLVCRDAVARLRGGAGRLPARRAHHRLGARQRRLPGGHDVRRDAAGEFACADRGGAWRISDGGAATYHVAFAKALARLGTVVVALTRPGYTDDRGRTSQGRSYGRQDNYTRDTIAAVSGAIAALKSHYRPRRVIYVGHSGGAAIGGVLIGRPDLIDAAVLVSCPCDLARWLRERQRPAWQRSESPLRYAGRVPRRTRVTVIAGGLDANTFPAQARATSRRLCAAVSMRASCRSTAQVMDCPTSASRPGGPSTSCSVRAHRARRGALSDSSVSA